MKAEEIAQTASDLDCLVTPNQADLLARYLDLLVKWNRKINLVGPHDAREIFETLIVDSLHLAGFIQGLDLPETPRCLDLGSGAGLPGIPLRILWTPGRYTLCEIREKRVVFLRTVLAALKLPGTEVYHGPAEDSLGPDEPRADLIVSRAFMPWDKLLPFSRPLLAETGHCLVLANEPPPAPPVNGGLPQGWTLAASASYHVRGKSRWFWDIQAS